jgi:hypothetical protein
MSDAHLSPLREFMTTASQAPVIVNGTAGDLFKLWQERTGQIPPEDFSDNLAVQVGKACEPVIIRQCAKVGEITEQQRFVKHPTLPSISCTLDGYRAFDDAVIEAKTLNPWEGDRLADIKWYTPQVLVQMRCRGASRGILAMLRWASLECHEITFDEAYEAEVWARMCSFQLACETYTPPNGPLPELVPPNLWKSIDLAMVVPMPNWGPLMIAQMRQWSETKHEHRLHEDAKKSIKEMMPNDVGTVTYGGMSVTRSKSGAITTREKIR